jgi:hypothetical protein
MKSGLVWIGVGRIDDGPVNPAGESAGAVGAAGVSAGACASAVGATTQTTLRARQATAVDQRGKTPAEMATLRALREKLEVARRGMISRLL